MQSNLIFRKTLPILLSFGTSSTTGAGIYKEKKKKMIHSVKITPSKKEN